MYMDIFLTPILWTLVVVFLFGGLFMRGFAAYVLIIFGAVFTIIPIRSYFTQKTILLIMGAYILGVLIVRAIAHASPGRPERMNMAMAGFFVSSAAEVDFTRYVCSSSLCPALRVKKLPGFS